MKILVALLPDLVDDISQSVCVVVDVIRATTTLSILFERGCTEAVLAATPEEAMEKASTMHGRPLLIGEKGALKPEGFDYGNSPAEALNSEVNGKTIIFSSTNGVKAFLQVSEAPLALAASLRNAHTAAKTALDEALKRQLDVLLIASGRLGGVRPAFEDIYACGLIADYMIGAFPKQSTDPVSLFLPDPTRIAHAAYKHYECTSDSAEAARDRILGLLQQTEGGTVLARYGMGTDLPPAAEINASSLVPHLIRRPDGSLALTPCPLFPDGETC